ncbi:hypothetical protein PVAP13_6KG030950 [Panicum virgatum]|uniref:Uncharacterized protein n=1 Tax=Panicum virgatum TaxID=38727 RepID=A0A8T0R843_PANVG|nr:hypothetical protein PVAP13_6KG030950 [Panicum virgatum]
MEPAFRNSVLSRKEKESKYFRQSRSRASTEQLAGN